MVFARRVSVSQNPQTDWEAPFVHSLTRPRVSSDVLSPGAHGVYQAVTGTSGQTPRAIAALAWRARRVLGASELEASELEARWTWVWSWFVVPRALVYKGWFGQDQYKPVAVGIS